MANSTQSTGVPQRDCDRFLDILDAVFADERALTAQERVFFEEHAGSCSGCGVLADALEEIKSPAPVHIDAVKKAADTYFEQRRRRNALYPLVAAAAAIVLALSTVLFVQSRQPEHPRLQLEIAQGDVAVDDELARPRQSLDWRLGSRLIAREETLLIEDDALIIRLKKGAQIALSRHENKTTRLRLIDGEAVFELNPAATRSLVVETMAADVVVTGTVFSVRVLPDDVRVHVTRGSVRVEPKVASLSPIDVAAGQFVLLSRGDVEQESTDNDEKNAAVAVADDIRAKDEKEIPQKAASDESRRDTLSPAPDDRSEGAAMTRHQERPPLGELIRHARQCRSAGQWACAARKYQSVAKRFPHSPESLTVLVPLAEIELEKLGRPGAALRHYQKYLKHEPRGALAPEAYFGKCRTYEKLAKHKEEQECLRAFLQKFSKSIHARRAKTRLVAISDSKK